VKYELTPLISRSPSGNIIVDLNLNNAPEDFSLCKNLAEARAVAGAIANLKQFTPEQLLDLCYKGAQWPISLGYVKPHLNPSQEPVTMKTELTDSEEQQKPLSAYLPETVAYMAIGAFQELEAREKLADLHKQPPPLEALEGRQDLFIISVIEHATLAAGVYQWAHQNERLESVYNYDVSEWFGQTIASLMLDLQSFDPVNLLRLHFEQNRDYVRDALECPLLAEPEIGLAERVYKVTVDKRTLAGGGEQNVLLVNFRFFKALFIGADALQQISDMPKGATFSTPNTALVVARVK
jgi:hypothetical protein